MMEVCGDAENRLASELMQHEVQIEKDILDPLNQLAEVRHSYLHLLLPVLQQFLSQIWMCPMSVTVKKKILLVDSLPF